MITFAIEGVSLLVCLVPWRAQGDAPLTEPSARPGIVVTRSHGFAAGIVSGGTSSASAPKRSFPSLPVHEGHSCILLPKSSPPNEDRGPGVRSDSMPRIPFIGSPALEVQVSTEFDGTGQSDAIRSGGCGYWVPPDPHLAVSSTHIVQVVNQTITVFDKTGGVVYRNLLNSDAINPYQPVGFFGTGAGLSVFDPKVVFDPVEQRFFVVALEFQSPNSWINIAVSTDSSPEMPDEWVVFRTDATTSFSVDCINGPPPPPETVTAWVDYPGIGTDDNAVYVTANLFIAATTCPNNTINDFVGVKFRAFDKAAMLASPGMAVFNDVNIGGARWTQNTMGVNVLNPGYHTLPFTAQPAHPIASQGEMYFVSSDFVPNFPSGNLDKLELWAMLDPLGTPSITDPPTIISVPTFQNPMVDVEQQTASVDLDALDGRLLNAVRFHDVIYTAHAVRDPSSPRNIARWYNLDTSGTLIQSGAIDFGGAVETWMPAVAVNHAGQMGIVVARSSPTEVPSIYVSARAAASPLGALYQPKLLHASSSHYDDSCALSGGIMRWGDYYGIGIEPAVNSKFFWGIGEWTSSPSTWETRIGRFRLASLSP